VPENVLAYYLHRMKQAEHELSAAESAAAGWKKLYETELRARRLDLEDEHA
jgi:hypothetical protein